MVLRLDLGQRLVCRVEGVDINISFSHDREIDQLLSDSLVVLALEGEPINVSSSQLADVRKFALLTVLNANGLSLRELKEQEMHHVRATHLVEVVVGQSHCLLQLAVSMRHVWSQVKDLYLTLKRLAKLPLLFEDDNRYVDDLGSNICLIGVKVLDLLLLQDEKVHCELLLGLVVVYRASNKPELELSAHKSDALSLLDLKQGRPCSLQELRLIELGHDWSLDDNDVLASDPADVGPSVMDIMNHLGLIEFDISNVAKLRLEKVADSRLEALLLLMHEHLLRADHERVLETQGYRKLDDLLQCRDAAEHLDHMLSEALPGVPQFLTD